MKKSVLLSGAALMLCLSACQDTVNTTENLDKSAKPQYLNEHRFVTDHFLKNRLKLQGVRTAIAPGGNMVVEVSARNRRTGIIPQFWTWFTRENPYGVAYKFVWMDKNGITVDSPLSSVWHRVEIKPGETVYFRGTAPTPECKDFVLSLKESK